MYYGDQILLGEDGSEWLLTEGGNLFLLEARNGYDLNVVDFRSPELKAKADRLNRSRMGRATIDLRNSRNHEYTQAFLRGMNVPVGKLHSGLSAQKDVAKIRNNIRTLKAV